MAGSALGGVSTALTGGTLGQGPAQPSANPAGSAGGMYKSAVMPSGWESLPQYNTGGTPPAMTYAEAQSRQMQQDVKSPQEQSLIDAALAGGSAAINPAPTVKMAPELGQNPAGIMGGMAGSALGGKGGTGGQPAATTSTQGQYAPLAPQGNFNVNQASAGALQQSMQGAQAGMGFQPSAILPTGYQASTAQATGYNPSAMTSQGYGASTIGASPTVQAQNVQAGQLAGSNLSAYTNPYEDQVVQQTLSDLKGAQEKELNQMGAQATAANAFGGSRQGIAEAETRKGYADKAAQAVSGLRQAGFTQAQQMAQADIGTAQQAALANQQANLAAGTTTAGFGQQSNLSNQAALNAASQFGSSAANQAAATNMAAQNAAAQFGAGAANQMGLSNMAARNAASQYNAGNLMSAQQQNVANQMAAQGMRMGAGAQLGQLGQQAFGVGQTLQQNQAQQGLLQQGLQQALIDAARGQYAGYTGAPGQALSAPLAALGVTPVPQSTTTTNQRGLFDYLGLAAGAAGMSDTRLKTDIKPIGTHKGINLYTWSWNDEGKRIADPAQPTIGVMAQELRETHPHLVKAGEDGYLRVDYVGLNSELEAA